MKTERLITLLNETNQDSEIILRSHSGEISMVSSISMEERDYIFGQPDKPCIVINAGNVIKHGWQDLTVKMPYQSFWQRNYAIPWTISIISLAVALVPIVRLLTM